MTASANMSSITTLTSYARRSTAGRHATGVRQSRVHAPPIGTRRDGTPSKRVLDIEDVLRWAYRDELPKRRDDHDGSMGEYPSVSPMFAMAALGGRVENFSREPGFPAAMGEVHPDALIVEAAVLALSRYAEHRFAGALGLLTHLPAGLDEHCAMDRAMAQIVDLVRIKARLGARPSFAKSPEPAALVGTNGKVQVHVMRNGAIQVCGAEGKDRYPSGAYCTLVWDSMDAILFERAEYAAWWAGLDLLAHELTGKLATISVLPPSAAQLPWAGEVDLGKPMRVLDSPSSRAKLRDQQETELACRLLAHRRRNAPRRPSSKAQPAETQRA